MRWVVVVGGCRVLVDLRSDVARVNPLALLEKARGMRAPYCPDHPARPGPRSAPDLLVLIRFNTPYQVLCQFTDRAGRRTLSRLCAGARRPSRRSARLRQRSAPLLTDDWALQALIADPRHGLEKTYCAKVEGLPRPETLERLQRGVALKDGRTRPARVRLIAEPKDLWPREPPIRRRATIATI